MAKFMQEPQTFLFRKYLGFWGNLVANYDGCCHDGAFFAPVLDGFDQRMAVKLLLDAFTEEELAKLGAVQMTHGRFEPCGPLNELLQQMENFDGIMVAATNFSTSLDPATMRRFTYKLELDYLEEDGKRMFFERMFKAKLSDAEFSELDQLGNLTPGDFRTVRQELFYLGRERTNHDRIAALQSECALKKDGRRASRIGFAACWKNGGI